MIKANVIIGHYQWKKKIKNPNNYFKNKLKRISKIPFFKKKKQEFSIFLTNNKEMKSLNYKFRKKNLPTDVLSFPINKSGLIKLKFLIFLNLNLEISLKSLSKLTYPMLFE